MVLEIDNRKIASSVESAKSKINAKTEDTVLDFSSVERLDANGLRALEDLAAAAEQKSVKLSLRGTHVAVCKVLKLTKLTRRFSFVD